MGSKRRFEIYWQPFIGFGVSVTKAFSYQWDVTVSFPFFTVYIGLGKDLQEETAVYPL